MIVAWHGAEPQRLTAQEPASPGKRAAADSSLATIEGTVIYESDPARPWRQGRYYIKDARQGQLAEAVVALSARGLGRDAKPAAPSTQVIDQKNFQFVPESVALRAGDSVKFTNSDGATHNVHAAETIANFNINMPSDGEYVYQFKEAAGIGKPVRIGCVYHGSMRAWVFVFDHPYFQLTGNDGKFHLANVPPGVYQLEMSHPAGQLRWKERIEVKAGETRRIVIRVSPDDKL
jgi:plastocyanin